MTNSHSPNSSSMDEKLKYQSPEPSSLPKEASPKRSAEAAALDSSDGKINRKRASKACQSCRSRKVRCSVSDHGIPCYNCKLDELDCVVPERKRPTRTAKRQRSLGAVISEAVLRMDRSASDSGNSPPESTQGTTSQCGWDKPFHHPYETENFTSSSPSSLQQGSCTTEENSTFGNDALASLDLPPCDDELARWFSVMPPRVVDKMFNYLKALSQRGHRESVNSSHSPSDESQCHGNLRLLPSEQKRKPFRHCVTPRPPEYTRQMLGLSTGEPRSRGSPQPLSQEAYKGTSILQQLRDDYAAAAGRAQALEEAIQKVDSQFTRQQPRHSDYRYPQPDAYNEPPDCHNNGNKHQSSALTPPPEHQNSFVMSTQTIQQLEALLASVHKETDSRAATKQATPKEGMQDIMTAGSGKRDDEFQNTFDSLIDFGPGMDSMFQSFGYDFL
ncbi:hypothetical protein AJ79_03584 [Helicocarpus griseus UAMH5409]|uniref:Zn(2)-C6 fungal-type domain-containing protein n=1 Tax=Helicocarpus griseus UAMH5409 TaxID=1447875 RepID=A0A2B7XXU1_9EURO|nr:hypothetical protein AJ79_03584 [Helicocarpus griseus UAMH5409]